MKPPRTQIDLLNLPLIKEPMAKNTQPKYNTPALDKGLDILEFLSKEGVPLSQVEIAQGINRTPSEIYRMLVCLEERGYLTRGSNAGKYRLSLKMYGLSHRHTPFDELKRVARYPMQSLSESTRQSCHLSIMNNDQLLIISQMRSPSAVSLSIEEGTHFPLSKTTSGSVFLSTLTQKRRKEILERDPHFPKWTKTEQQDLLTFINKVEKDGYSFSNSKLTSGVTDIAVPIGINESGINAVLAISVFTSSLESDQNLNTILLALQKTQAEINKYLGE
ncbi:transcriptional regulator, IclR family [Lutibacter oricola]|uniref:Transcriptional regulator, IclR family n=1 Tax=Lutibacter oricola TaxID=762486 RepID=A0A1H2ZPD2_9FLAO|nr:IclR family transcriptional regulator [Lutibacter oricola]SDX19257.1 transcriptional regulator, IclR family [Lutibacter oricola]